MKEEETVVLERVFEAPRARVFEAWTRAVHLQRWFGPRGFRITDCETEPRAGGIFRLRMHAPDGRAFWVRGAYREVVAPERLVIACTAEDEAGHPALEEVIRVVLEELGGKTKLVLNATARGTGPVAARMLGGMHEGWAQTVDRLGVVVNPKPQQET